MQQFKRALSIGALVLGAASTSHASGFALMEQGTSGLGMAYAGAAAAAWDASTVWWNPAGMSKIKGLQVVSSGIVVAPSSHFSDNGTSVDALGNPATVGPGDAGVSALVPSFFATWQFAKDWTAGISVNAPFGLTTEWNSGWVGRFFATRSQVTTYNINPSISWQAHERVSIGGGVNVQYLDGDFRNAARVPGEDAAQARGFDWAIGWNVGALFEIYEGTELGLAYRSTMHYNVLGNATFTATPALNGPIQASITLPDSFSVALSHRFNDKFRLAGDWTWTGWNSIKALTFTRRTNGTVLSSETLNWRNSWRVGVGGEYQICDSWLVRAGFAFDKTPVQDATRTPRLPGANRYWFSVGGQYSYKDKWKIDAGYTFITTDNVSSSLSNPGVKGTLNGTYNGHVHLLGIQVVYHLFEKEKKAFVK